MSDSSRLARSVTVPPATASVGAARRFVTAQLREGGLDEALVDTAALLVSEIVTNAVLHANTEVSVHVAVGDGVLVRVVDGSRLLPQPRQHHVESATGRGLELVEALASDYGVQVLSGEGSGEGKAVWFTLQGARPPGEVGWGISVDETAATALLRGVPVGLYEVLQEHDEALLREYDLYRLSGGETPFSAEEVAAAARARVHIADAVRRSLAGTDGSPTRLDVHVGAPADGTAGLRLLPAVSAEAEGVAAGGRLLTRPALPELRALRDWIFGQLLGQLGAPGPTEPTPWTAPVDPGEPLLPAATVDCRWVNETPRGVIVADDGNRILAVSSAAAELLGWTPADLVGQRITAVVPRAARDAHVTGFTRHLITGRESLLGRPLELSALHRRGHEVPVRLTLERRQSAGRTVFLGWLDRRPRRSRERDPATQRPPSPGP